MKYKLHSFPNNFLNDKIKLLSVKSTALAQFELQEVPELPEVPDGAIEELLKKNYDVIEFDGSQYVKFKPFIKTVDWQTNHLLTADCLLLKNNQYKPYNILAEALMRVLKKNIGRINSQLPVIIIGDTHFAVSVVTKLALSGFIEIVVSLIDSDEQMLKEFEGRIKSFVFNLNLKIIPIDQLTSADQAGFLLISNFKKEKNKDAYELLTYFNFLSEKAVFIDCNSINDSLLVDDARRADIFVIDEVEILENKYNNLLELLKNY